MIIYNVIDIIIVKFKNYLYYVFDKFIIFFRFGFYFL